jgi:glycosyltransferase involved in cell wall biosynthesis
MAAYGLSGESIVCFAGEDWWYHHPHSKNHLLKRFAQENRVLFVNSLTMGLPAVGNADFFLKIRRKLKSQLRWLRKVPEGLFVLTPLSLPFYGSRAIRSLNRFLIAFQVRLVMWLCGMRHPIVWAAIPSAATVVDLIPHKALLYQVSDKYDANEDSALASSQVREFDRQLQNNSDVVLYSGRRLFEESRAPHRYFLEQAVDFEHFATPAAELATAMTQICHPVLGYFGWMDYVMDLDLIHEVARRRPEWHWVFIGRKSNLVHLSASNIHFIGAKEYRDLPSYVAGIDVFVLPWRQNHAFTSYGSAIKVREYLATGKPVVISPLYEYRNTPGVRIYHSVDEFISLVENALTNDTPDQSKVRQDSVRGGSWDVRAAELGNLIARLIAEPATSLGDRIQTSCS